MSQYDIVFMMLVGVIAFNQFIIRSSAWHTRMYLFWIPQLINVSVGSYALLFGLPGVPLPLDVINWVIGGLFLVHFTQNQTKLFRFQREQREDAMLREREQMNTDTEENASENS